MRRTPHDKRRPKEKNPNSARSKELWHTLKNGESCLNRIEISVGSEPQVVKIKLKPEPPRLDNVQTALFPSRTTSASMSHFPEIGVGGMDRNSPLAALNLRLAPWSGSEAIAAAGTRRNRCERSIPKRHRPARRPRLTRPLGYLLRDGRQANWRRPSRGAGIIRRAKSHPRPASEKAGHRDCALGRWREDRTRRRVRTFTGRRRRARRRAQFAAN